MTGSAEIEMDFVCMGDDKYVRWLELCIPAIIRSHPRARVFLFDLSRDASPAVLQVSRRLRETVYVPYPEAQWRWPQWIDTADFEFFWPNFDLRESLKYWSRRARAALSGRAKEDWMTDKRLHTEKMKRFCRVVSLKPRVLSATLEQTRRNVAFIDADAIVLKSLAPVFQWDFDLAATIEAPEDVVIGPDPSDSVDRPSYPIRAINTGVLFVRNSAAARSLLTDWLQEMEHVRHIAVEQTALANLLLRRVHDFLSSCYLPRVIATAAGRAHVLALPMATYNCTRVRPGTERMPDVSVVHFVGSKKKSWHWEAVSSLVRRSIGLTERA